MFRTLWSIPKFEKDGLPKRDPINWFNWGVMSKNAVGNDMTGLLSNVKEFWVSRDSDKLSVLFFGASANAMPLGTIVVYLEDVRGVNVKTFTTLTFENCYFASVWPGTDVTG